MEMKSIETEQLRNDIYNEAYRIHELMFQYKNNRDIQGFCRGVLLAFGTITIAGVKYGLTDISSFTRRLIYIYVRMEYMTAVEVKEVIALTLESVNLIMEMVSPDAINARSESGRPDGFKDLRPYVITLRFDDLLRSARRPLATQSDNVSVSTMLKPAHSVA